jgi:hypothetical protein
MLQRRLIGIGTLVIVFAVSTGSPVMAAGNRSASVFLLSTGSTYQMSGDRIHKYVSYTFTLLNGSSRQVLVNKIGQNGPGLQLLVPSGSGMTQKLVPSSGPGKTQTIPPHKSIRLTVWFRVSDCATVPKGSWPLTMEAAWSSGKWQRVSLGLTSGLSVQWQKSLANLVCP